jgi:hypothetical protein
MPSSSPRQSARLSPQPPLQLIVEATYWLSRSEKLQKLADTVTYPPAKHELLRIAENYCRIAEEAYERARRELEADSYFPKLANRRP